ncbi:CPBP family intramembrane metalloprotease, partial [Aquimarina sp. U1-2]|uniref:CPBP family intramembrane glutamic endopeptidase n=1 Tax=Aquimarina sp. U1-2 TaxID=2823141 RepID=UPI001AECE260
IDIPEKLNISYSYNLALILNATKIILIVPIVEEFVFRGIILKLINFKYSTLTSLIISSTLFSLIHFNPLSFSLITLVTTFVTGMVFGVLLLRFGLFYSILGHIIFNLIWFILKMNEGIYFGLIKSLSFNITYWFVILISLGITVFLFVNFIKKTRS